MVAYQTNASVGNGTVTLRVDFNYSGNCCGGAFSWDTGETGTSQRSGWVPDGIDNGAYTTDEPPTPGTFSDGSPFTWTRSRPDPSVPLVRIDITWDYPAGANVYTITWDDCCPQSNQKAVMVSGQAFQPQRILAADTGNASLPAAFAQAAIPACPVGGTGTIPLCYDLVSPLVLPVSLLNTYDAILVASEAQAATVTALGSRTADLDTWLHADAHGIAVYGQSDPASFGWLPKNGGTLAVSTTFANDVSVTPSGMAHLSHVNQLPSVAGQNGSLAGWSMSTFDTFGSWPAYFAQPLGDPLATLTNGAAVALAGHYGTGPGCEVVTGQPVDDRAATGRAAAQQMFRSTLAYALTCTDAARA
jgi:hypothetical protein